MTETKESRKEQRDKWLLKMNEAEKKFADYYALINEIRQYYRNDRQKNKQNIFWASVETLKPFLYFKQPQPYIERISKMPDPAENMDTNQYLDSYFPLAIFDTTLCFASRLQ